MTEWLIRLPRYFDTELVCWPHTDDVNHWDTFSRTGIGCPMLVSGLNTAAPLPVGTAASCERACFGLCCFDDECGDWFSMLDGCAFTDNRLGSCSGRFDRHATPSGRLNTVPSCSVTSKAAVLLALSINTAFLLCTVDTKAGASSRRELEALGPVSTAGRSDPRTIVAFFETRVCETSLPSADLLKHCP